MDDDVHVSSSPIPMRHCEALHHLVSIFHQNLTLEISLFFYFRWTVVFQFLFSIPLTLPLAAVGDPSVPPSKYLANLWGGLKCFVGINTITGEGGGHPDDCLPWAPLYFMMYIVFNIVFSLVLFMTCLPVIKYESCIFYICMNVLLVWC